MHKLSNIVILSLFSISAAFAAEPENLSLHKQQLVNYHDSGAYYKDISNVAKDAMVYMKFRINQHQRLHSNKKLAIVFDIDETTLSNYEDMQQLQFGGSNAQIEALEEDANDPAIPFTKTLFSYAEQHGISVFFITGRREGLRKATIENLKEDGFSGWKALYMKPDNYHKASVVPYKLAMRKRIEKEGYDIIINIGDQESDLVGGHADMAFKVPDPYYLIT